jgi:sialate O-acetylesterase
MLMRHPLSSRLYLAIRWILALVVPGSSCCLSAGSAAEVAPVSVRPAKVFGSHMVLQHSRPIAIWGEGRRGEAVRVSLGSDLRETVVDEGGRWSVQLPARAPSTEPLTLQVNALTFDDVLVGDVWLCSGQSNLAFGLKLTPTGKADRTAMANPLVRVAHHTALRLRAPDGYTDEELARCNVRDFFRCQWLTDADPAMGEASAVAWYFGHRLQSAAGVPIGLIVVALGGSALNNWIPAAALRDFPGAKSLFTTDWFNHPDVKPLHRTRGQDALKRVLELGRPFLVGKTPYRWMCEPAFLFEAGIEPLQALGLRGVIWYQGESDAADERAVALATHLLPMLVATWRTMFRMPELPWLFVQLPGHEPPLWPAFRELQSQVAKRVGHVALAVTIDLGDKTNVHPVEKKPVGERLARLALREVYGQTSVGIFPEVKSASGRAGHVQLQLTECDGGMMPVAGPISGFELAGKDGIFFPAPARMTASDTVEVDAAGKAVTQVRYLWTSYPEPRPQLLNQERLPLGPFVRPLSPGP